MAAESRRNLPHRCLCGSERRSSFGYATSHDIIVTNQIEFAEPFICSKARRPEVKRSGVPSEVYWMSRTRVWHFDTPFRHPRSSYFATECDPFEESMEQD